MSSPSRRSSSISRTTAISISISPAPSARGNDGFIGDWTNSPGRLLANDTRAPGHVVLTDRTLESQLLDITDMDYGHNPPRRRSPGTNWHKRDFIYLEDKDSYSETGVSASRQSLIRRSVLHARGRQRHRGRRSERRRL